MKQSMILPAYYLSTMFKLPSNLRFHKTSISLLKGVTLSLSIISVTQVAQAQLPMPIEKSLREANINSNDLSLIILPINSLKDSTPIDNLKGTPKIATTNGYSSPLATALHKRLDLLEKETEATASKENQADDHSQPIESDIKTKKSIETPELTLKSKPLKAAIYHRPNVARTPASTMKLIPTFVALDLLGPDFTWYTDVYYSGYIAANTLYGDLIIKGSGDPKLTYQRLDRLLGQVKKTGIQHIEGNIILDSSVFGEVGKDPAAFDNDPLRPYNASPDGLLINFNSIEMTTLPVSDIKADTSQTTAKYAKALYSPMLADYKLPDLLPIRNNGRCRTIKASLDPKWESKELKFAKGLPQSCGQHSFYIAYPDPKEFAKRVVKYQWQNLDTSNLATSNLATSNLATSKFYLMSPLPSRTTLSGKVIETRSSQNTLVKKPNYFNINSRNNEESQDYSFEAYSIKPSSPLPIVSYPSLPLSKQIYDINHFSNNVMTEQITLSLPVYAPSNSTDTPKPSVKTFYEPSNHSTYPKALKVIDNWWQTHLKTKPPKLTNGSGLCRDCSVTANNLAELLNYAYMHPNFTPYLNSLGIAGISGTIAGHSDRLPDSKAVGRAWIKTGTLNNVTSIAGYVHGHSGQDYIVVGIINNSSSGTLNTYQARRVLDTMLDWTAQH